MAETIDNTSETVNKGKMYHFVNNIKNYFKRKKDNIIQFFVRNKTKFILLTISIIAILYFIRVLFIPTNIWVRTHLLEVTIFISFTFLWMLTFYKTFTVVGKMKKSKMFLLSFFPLGVSLSVIFFSFFITDFNNNPFQVARYIVAHDNIEKIQIDNLPTTDIKYIRAMPNEAVLPILRDKMKSSDQTINHVELSYDYLTDDFLWLGEITPIGNYNKIISDVHGLYGMSATKVNLKPITFKADFKYGQKLTWFNDITYNVNKLRPFINTFDSQLDDNIRAFRISEDEQVRIVSVIDYDGFFGVPKFGGVYIIHQENKGYKKINPIERELGIVYTFLEKQYYKVMDMNVSDIKTPEIEFVSVENIKNYPYLKNQNLVPEEVTEFYAKSWSYRNGIQNVYIDKKGLTKITKLPGEKNKQPFNLYYDEFNTTQGLEKAGIYQLYILEPKGSNKGVNIALLFDSSGYTNDIRVMEVDFAKNNYNLVGPEAVEQPIVAHFPNMAWDKFIITESKLITFNRNDKIKYYYLNSIISTGENSFSKPLTILVNAETLEITNFGMEYTYKKLEEYLATTKINITNDTIEPTEENLSQDIIVTDINDTDLTNEANSKLDIMIKTTRENNNAITANKYISKEDKDKIEAFNRAKMNIKIASVPLKSVPIVLIEDDNKTKNIKALKDKIRNLEKEIEEQKLIDKVKSLEKKLGK